MGNYRRCSPMSGEGIEIARLATYVPQLPLEDFATYTEVDPNGHISIGVPSSLCSVSGLTRNEDAYVYSDKGAAHFSDAFVHYEKVSGLSGVNEGLGLCWALTNSIDDWVGLCNAHDVAIGLYCRADISYFALDNAVTGSQDLSIKLPGTDFYLTIRRSPSTMITCEIYSNVERTSLLDSISVAVGAAQTYRYIFAVNSYNYGYALKTASFDVANLQLG